MKKKIAIVLLAFLIFIPSNIVYSAVQNVDSVPHIGSFGDTYGQNKLFKVDDTFYIFYVEDTTQDIVYKFRRGGGWWQGPYIVRVGTFTNLRMIDVAYHDGSFHIAYWDINYAGPLDRIYYNKKDILISGLLAVGVWVLAVDGQVNYDYSEIRIGVDSSDHPWIAYERDDAIGGSDWPWVTTSSYTNTSWNTEVGFPQAIWVNHGTWAIQILPLENDAIMFMVWENNINIGYRLWNGTGWNQTAEFISEDTPAGLRASFATDKRKVYGAYFNNTNYYLRFLEWNSSLKRGWTDIELGDVGDSVSYPSVTALTNKNGQVIFWTKNNNHVYYKVRSYGIWDTTVDWFTEADVISRGHSTHSTETVTLTTSPIPDVGFGWLANLSPIRLRFDWLSKRIFGYPPNAPYLVINTTDIFDGDGNLISGNGTTGYLLENEYYELSAQFNNTHYAKLNFTDGKNIIDFEYWNDTKIMMVSCDNQFVISYVSSEYLVNATLVDLTWGFILNKEIKDVQNVNLYYYAEDLYGNYTSAFTNTFFNIYNLGGIVTYDFNGDGQRVDLGDPFDLQATNGSLGSYAYAEEILRKIQHVNLLMEIDFGNDYNIGNDELDILAGWGYVDVGIDYYYQGSWINGIMARLYIQDGDVGRHAGGNDHSWVEMLCDWYNRGWNNKTQYFLTYHEGYDKDKPYGERLSTQIWIDLYFPRENASKLIGGHVNPYYHGMREYGNAWWFGYGTFRPLRSNYSEALFIDNLYDGAGGATLNKSISQIITCSDMELFKFWIKVAKLDNAASNDDTWTVTHQVKNIRQADDIMKGIDRPDFVETKDPSMPQGGWTNPIARLIGMLGGLILNGIISAIKYIGSMMGTFLEQWLGIPIGFWSQLLEFIKNIPLIFIALLENIPILISSVIDSITSILSLLVIIPRWLIFVGMLLASFLEWYRQIVSLFTGGWVGVADIWNTLEMEQWLSLIVSILIPVYIVDDIASSRKPFERAMWYVDLLSGIAFGVVDFFKKILEILRSMLGMIRDVLPI